MKLVNPSSAAALKRADKGNVDAVVTIKGNADTFAADLRPIILSITQEGTVSLFGIAKALDGRQIKTARGGEWHKTTVANLLARLQD